MRVRLQVNVDHVATLRQARGGEYPDPLRAAVLCELAGADGITVHLREDRRHIQDEDVWRIRSGIQTRLNLEMAATAEMVAIAKKVRPDCVTLVPEKREERTTEGGLDVFAHAAAIKKICDELQDDGIPVSLFIDPDLEQVTASVAVGATAIELHTGDYANAEGDAAVSKELKRICAAAAHAAHQNPDIIVAAGHGLTRHNVENLIREAIEISELNIGHALVSDAVLLGIQQSVQAFRRCIQDARRARSEPPPHHVSP